MSLAEPWRANGLESSMILRRAIPLGAAALVALTGLTARAQVGPTPFPSGPSGGGQDQKKEGVAVAAPKTPGLLPTTPSLPPPKSHRKRLQLIQLDGYLRLRTNWRKNFNLGFLDDPTVGGAPWPLPLGCNTTGAPCGNSLKDANIRLRFEPTINIDETTAVHAQIDVLDNQVLGATPEGTYLDGSMAPGNIPMGAFSGSITSPLAGVNDSRDSIAVKRAWAEVGTPLGLLTFGRMPDHWGLGMMHNSGGEDPVNGGYDLDANYGDTVDRVAFSALIPGTNIRGMIATDWPATRLVSSQTSRGTDLQTGTAFDLDDNDDVSQWSIIVSHLDSPTDFKDAVARGELAFNWGAYLTQRKQAWDYNPIAAATTTAPSVGGNPDPAAYVQRNYKAYIIDPWIKLGWHKWDFEAEAVAVIGSVGNVSDLCSTTTVTRETQCNPGPIDLRQFGGVARATYHALDGKLRLGIEGGYASGDQYDGQDVVAGTLKTVPGEINIAHAQLIPDLGDKNMSQFIFDREFKPDYILFRQLIGAVTNAVYVKPRLEYDISKSFMLRAWNVTSAAARSVATPGNASLYGIEFDGDVGYHAGGLFAGISYGVLFPLGALGHPADDTATTGGTGFGYDVTNQGDPTTAHTIMTRVVVKF
jgi:uncharacterized protein (TIGR04551 family)